MFKSGETSHKAIDVLLLVALVMGLALILDLRSSLPQSPAKENTYSARLNKFLLQFHQRKKLIPRFLILHLEMDQVKLP